MNKKSGSGSGLFLMEMTAVVFFFILCASICIQVFVRADTMSRLARDTNQSVLLSESIVEVWKTDGCDGLTAAFGAEKQGQGSYVVYRDHNWNSARQEQAEYRAFIMESEDRSAAATVTVTVTKGGQELYSLNARQYRAPWQYGATRIK